MRTATKKSERPAQRRRTRKAIIDATIDLVAQGNTPSIADIAVAADVSRRTVYMYFPTLEQLLIDATLGALSQAPVDRAIESSAPGDDADGRVERMVRALHRVSPETERLGRALIRLTVDARARGTKRQLSPSRGYRRVEWIEQALAPLREDVDKPRFDRLVSALAMVIGWEALIVQRDIRGLSPAEGEELSVWAARALLKATLQEGDQSRRRRASRATARRP